MGYEKLIIITFINVERGRGEEGQGEVRWGGFKKSKPIPALPHDARLKSRPIAAPPPLQGGENNRGAKQGGTNQEGQGERERAKKHLFFPIQDIHKNDKLVATTQHRVEANITTSLDSHFYIFPIYYELNF